VSPKSECGQNSLRSIGRYRDIQLPGGGSPTQNDDGIGGDRRQAAFPANPDDIDRLYSRNDPLMLATGAGANASKSIGISVANSMLISTVLSIFVVLALYMIVRSLEERWRPMEHKETEQSSDRNLLVKHAISRQNLNAIYVGRAAF
jgi:hypothetical protein